MNRLLLFLPHDCPHCRAESRLNRLRSIAERIEESTGEILEFWMPSAASLIDDDTDKLEILIRARPEPVAFDADIAAHVIGELRRLAEDLLGAAAKVEATEGGAI